jgi:hypothetical protein
LFTHNGMVACNDMVFAVIVVGNREGLSERGSCDTFILTVSRNLTRNQEDLPSQIYELYVDIRQQHSKGNEIVLFVVVVVVVVVVVSC